MHLPQNNECACKMWLLKTICQKQEGLESNAPNKHDANSLQIPTDATWLWLRELF